MFGIVLFIALTVVVGSLCRNLSDQSRNNRFLQNTMMENSVPDIPSQAVMHIDNHYGRYGDNLVRIGVVPQLATFEQFGPSLRYLEYFEYAHPNPSCSDLLTVIETDLALMRLEQAEKAMSFFSCYRPTADEQMRFVNAQMKLYILTGRTHQAAELFARTQDTADAYYAAQGRGLIHYLDNAAVICALSGDFDEAYRYCAAMKNVVFGDGKATTADLYPYLTEMKVMFLQGNTEDAEVQYIATERIFNTFPDYQYYWEKQYMLSLLARTRQFQITDQNGDMDEQSMPELGEM